MANTVSCELQAPTTLIEEGAYRDQGLCCRWNHQDVGQVAQSALACHRRFVAGDVRNEVDVSLALLTHFV